MIEDLTAYNYTAREYERISGTEDWVEVADLGEGGYDWTEFKAFYSPSARRYFWHGDGGCSCSSWGDRIDGAADFENGDRADLLRAWESFARDNEYTFTPTDYLDGVSTIRAFKTPEPEAAITTEEDAAA